MAADNRRDADYIRQYAFDLETKGMTLTPEQRKARQDALLRMTPKPEAAPDAFPTAYVAAGAGLLILLVGGVVYLKRRKGGLGCALGDAPEAEAAFTRALEEEHDLTPDIRRALHLAKQDRHIAAAFWQAAGQAQKQGSSKLAASFRAAGDRWGGGTRGVTRYDRPGGGR